MAKAYSEIPLHFDELEDSFITGKEEIKNLFFSNERKHYFYDTCSFQYHAGLKKRERDILIRYFHYNKAVLFLTRTILMELAGLNQVFERNCVHFIKELHSAGIALILFDEEITYYLLSICYSDKEVIHSCLQWAVRNISSPQSTTKEIIESNRKLYGEVIEGRPTKANLFQRFFHFIRKHKSHRDDLGEELIGICLHTLTSLEGIGNGKISLITDDKEAASNIYRMLKKRRKDRKPAVVLYSTPKLVQQIHEEDIGISKEEMVEMLSCLGSGNVAVMGTRLQDLELQCKISLSPEELASLILKPKGINIVF